MKRFTKRFVRWSAAGAMALGTTFQVGSCSIDENGVFNAFADTLALGELQGQLFEASPFADFAASFEGGHGPFGGFGNNGNQ